MDFVKFLFLTACIAYFPSTFFWDRAGINWPLLLTATALHAFYFYGWVGLIFLLTAGFVSTLIELVSLKTPLNFFGVAYRYHLHHALFPSHIVLAKVYPVEVTAAWLFLKYISFFLAGNFFSLVQVNPVFKVLTSALILVSFDLLIDPVAVSGGAWVWSKPGRFFGIPWQNFLGWFFTGIVTSSIFSRLHPSSPSDFPMAFPVLLVIALVLLSLTKKLIAIHPIRGLLAAVPLSAFFLLGIYSTFLTGI